MKLAFPEYALWLLGIPVSLGVIYLVYKRVSQITDLWFSPDQYARSRPLTKFWLRTAGFLLLFVSLLGPYWNDDEGSETLMAREIFILLDVSGSMNAADIAPSRLEKAKRELDQLIQQLAGDRLGLILFTENAYVQCPLTLDHEAVRLFLDMAETGQFDQTGTQFRAALSAAMDRFARIETQTRNTSRVIVLVSDGEDFGDTYASLVDRLQQAGVTIFTVGVGTYEGAPVPHYTKDGQQQGYKRYADGTMAISRLNDTELQNIASAFGTEYLLLDDSYKNLVELEEQIYAITASPQETNRESVTFNQYQLFLFLAIVLIGLSLFMMPVRKV